MPRKEIGAFIYRYHQNNLEIMLVSNRKQTRWILPKGQPESRCSDPEVALEEAYEEAGVAGRLDDCPASIVEYTSASGEVALHIYRMQVERLFEKWPERFFRHRQWVDISTALLMVRKKRLRAAIEQIADEILEQAE